ncbi:Hypothetical predicted protein, partial [Mytilus galloprovincialis]
PLLVWPDSTQEKDGREIGSPSGMFYSGSQPVIYLSGSRDELQCTRVDLRMQSFDWKSQDRTL